MNAQTAREAEINDDQPRWKVLGPGLLSAATGVGAADLVATLVAGSSFGYMLLWAAIVGCLLKIILVEGVGRYHLATGRTIFQGWRSLGAWTTVYFGIYIVVWGFMYGATAMASTAMPLAALFPSVDAKVFAIGSGLLGLILVWLGKYGVFEKVMAAMVAIMFVSVVGSALLAGPHLGAMLKGLVPLIPSAPNGVFITLALAGGVGGTITLAAYGYWLREKGWSTPRYMKVMRIDNAVGYGITGVFVIATMILGVELMHSAGVALKQNDGSLLKVAEVLDAKYGVVWSKLFLVGFWAASFSSLLGVWHGVSLMFADFFTNMRKKPEDLSEDLAPGSDSKPARAFMLWLTFPPMILVLAGAKPVLLLMMYGVLGSFFMPFLALTLLFLLNGQKIGEWRNNLFTNIVLGLTAVVFLVLGVNELIKAINR